MDILTAPLREASTKREILLLLKRCGSITIQEMSDRLGLTGMAIRRHVQALQKDKYVHISLQRQQVGRPTYVYSLTALSEQLFPTQYDVLSLELIDEIQQMFGDEYVDKLFVRRMEKLVQKYRTALSGSSLEERAAQLARLQNEAGYMARLEKLQEGNYLFEEGNCPIYQVASRYRQACQCELAMFASLLGAEVLRKDCIADGGTACCYLLKERLK